VEKNWDPCGKELIGQAWDDMKGKKRTKKSKWSLEFSYRAGRKGHENKGQEIRIVVPRSGIAVGDKKAQLVENIHDSKPTLRQEEGELNEKKIWRKNRNVVGSPGDGVKGFFRLQRAKPSESVTERTGNSSSD